MDLRGYFACCKADDEDRLTPAKEDNAAARKIDRKDGLVLELIGYSMARGAKPSDLYFWDGTAGVL